MNISLCVQPAGTIPPPPLFFIFSFFFSITDLVRSGPMKLGAMTQSELDFSKLILSAVKWKCPRYGNAFIRSILFKVMRALMAL